MVVVKVFGLEPANKTLFKAGNAKTSAPRLHARLHPDDVADKVNFGVAVYCLRNALIPVDFESSFKLNPAEKSGRGVEATVNTKPTLDDIGVA
jgi:hypothetical protein